MADLRAALGHALEPAYRVEREVRPVGNCRMFVALEKSAGDSLLVKVLPGPLSLALDSRRFEQEIGRLGRRLQHPRLVAPAGRDRWSTTPGRSSRAPPCGPGSRATASCRCDVPWRCCGMSSSRWPTRMPRASPTAI